MTKLDDAELSHPQSNYRYERFTMGLMVKDLRFGKDALRPGDKFPGTNLLDIRGNDVNLGEERDRPLLLVTASITCPMTESSMPVVEDLYREFGDRVDFALLATREAHPGENYPQPHTAEDKALRAKELSDHHSLPFTVVVDDIDGTVHRLLDGKPNTAYVIDPSGTVAFRSHWARDERSLRSALTSVVNGSAPDRAHSGSMLGPVAKAMGSVDQVMHKAGPQAKKDLWLSGVPMAMAGKVAKVFGFSNPDHRGIAAVVSLGVGMVAIAAILIAVL